MEHGFNEVLIQGEYMMQNRFEITTKGNTIEVTDRKHGETIVYNQRQQEVVYEAGDYM